MADSVNPTPCEICGALVVSDGTERHQRWHESLRRREFQAAEANARWLRAKGFTVFEYQDSNARGKGEREQAWPIA